MAGVVVRGRGLGSHSSRRALRAAVSWAGAGPCWPDKGPCGGGGRGQSGQVPSDGFEWRPRVVAGAPPSPPFSSLWLPLPPHAPYLDSLMTAWIILPISLSTFSITGIWIVYAMAVMNQHVCPVENWSYNESCSSSPAMPGSPKSCCTLEDVPLISKCGTYPPESCLFSLIGNVGAFMVVLICLLRYGQLLEQSHRSWVNTTALVAGCTNAAGLVVVGNFQVDYAKSLHYMGAGIAFPAGLLFVCLQCVLTYHAAASPLDGWMAHLRVSLTAVALISLVLSGVFFIHESPLLQHLAAVCEWVFVIDMLVFYGTFAYDFGAVSTDTLVAALQQAGSRGCKSPGSSSTSTHLNCTPESMAMI